MRQLSSVRVFRLLETSMVFLLLGSPADAQRPRSEVRGRQRTGASASDDVARNTTVTIEILTRGPGAGLTSLAWRPIFERLGMTVRMRPGIGAEKPRTQERRFGRLRRVTVTGRLGRRGELIFEGRKFTTADAAALKEWLRDLKTYGAQGTPKGKPLWGLTRTQFQTLYSALSRTITVDVAKRTLESALKKINPAADYPVRYSVAAGKWMKNRFSVIPTVRQSTRGITRGTALAMLLREYGLGFRPLRTPEGKIELTLEPLSKVSDVWPVGWKLRESRIKTVPGLFKFVPVELNGVPLPDVLHAIEVRTGIPIRTDSYRIHSSGIDMGKIQVTYPRRKTTWSQLIRGVTTSHKLARRYRIDERGHPFIWITTLDHALKTIRRSTQN